MAPTPTVSTEPCNIPQRPNSSSRRRSHQRPPPLARPAAPPRQNSGLRPRTRGKRNPPPSPSGSRSAQQTGWTVCDVQTDYEDLSLAFPHYCTVCEREIPAQNNSDLYCSEQCRERDSQISPTFSLFTQDACTPSAQAVRRASLANAALLSAIAPQMSLTEQASIAAADAAAFDNGEVAAAESLVAAMQISEAAMFLSKFHSSEVPMDHVRPPRSENPQGKEESNTDDESSTDAVNANASTTSTIPSLSHTPTSSMDQSSAQATPPDILQYNRSMQQYYHSMQDLQQQQQQQALSYFGSRPLPPRTQPRGNSFSWLGGPIDLVTPVPGGISQSLGNTAGNSGVRTGEETQPARMPLPSPPVGLLAGSAPSSAQFAAHLPSPGSAVQTPWMPTLGIRSPAPSTPQQIAVTPIPRRRITGDATICVRDFAFPEERGAVATPPVAMLPATLKAMKIFNAVKSSPQFQARRQSKDDDDNETNDDNGNEHAATPTRPQLPPSKHSTSLLPAAAFNGNTPAAAVSAARNSLERLFSADQLRRASAALSSGVPPPALGSDVPTPVDATPLDATPPVVGKVGAAG